jgi:hypothetical protein
MTSSITIEFFVPNVNDTLIISESKLSVMNEVFKTTRTQAFEVDLPKFVPASGTPSYYYTSKNYRNVFDADYNQSNLFTTSASFGIAGQGLGTVVITANYNGAVFSVVVLHYTATINNVAYSQHQRN